MRGRVEALLRSWWSGKGGFAGTVFRVLSLPLSWIYGGIVLLGNRRVEGGGAALARAAIPVISVGNLAVGGTGKTPFTRWVVQVLLEEGARPGVVASGYGEDEPALHRTWYPRGPVVTHRRRASGVQEAASLGATVAVLDDAFQHRVLFRDLDLILLAAEHPYPVRLLPTGPYRESLAALRRADRVIVTRRIAPESDGIAWKDRVQDRYPDLPVARVRLAPMGWAGLRGEPMPPPRGPLLAVSGVASPEGFAQLVREYTGETVDLRAFRDHHDFSSGDLESIEALAGSRTVVITEKDAVKWEKLPPLKGPVRVLTLGLRFEEGEGELIDALRRVVSVGAQRGK